MLNIFDQHKKLAILSPCSKKWGEKKIIPKNGIKYFWFLYDNAIFIRRKFIEEIFNLKNLAIKIFYSMVQISEAMVSKVKLLLKLIQIIGVLQLQDQCGERKMRNIY